MSNQAKRSKKHYSGKEKISILRKHLIEKVAVSELCDKNEIAPSVFYKWQAQLFEQGEKVFEQSNNAEKVKPSEYEKKIQTLEEKLVRKAEVVSKLMEEHIKLKKNLGLS
jgi:transposase